MGILVMVMLICTATFTLAGCTAAGDASRLGRKLGALESKVMLHAAVGGEDAARTFVVYAKNPNGIWIICWKRTNSTAMSQRAISEFTYGLTQTGGYSDLNAMWVPSPPR